MMNKRFSLFLIVLILALLPLQVMAQEFDPARKGSIHLSLMAPDGKTPMEGAEFTVFQVATVVLENGDMVYHYTEDFAGCGFYLDDSDLIAKLDGYVLENVAPVEILVTDARGEALCENLTPGLYFLVQTDDVEGFVPCESFLVTIPGKTGDSYCYDVDASPKTEVARFIDITIRKVWNTGKDTAIPTSVTVQLLRGSTVVETVVLNAENNWQVTLTGLPESDSYRIVELGVPQGFTATYSRKEFTFTVTNTPSLAQTGQLIWPIPVLAATGLFFLLVGVSILRKAGKSHG